MFGSIPDHNVNAVRQIFVTCLPVVPFSRMIVVVFAAVAAVVGCVVRREYHSRRPVRHVYQNLASIHHHLYFDIAIHN